MLEQDRFNPHKYLYIIGMICLLLSLICLGFFLFILPYLIWGFNYDVPMGILDLQVWFTEEKQYSIAQANTYIAFFFLIPGLVLGFLASIFSNKIDDDILHIPHEHTQEEEEDIRETVNNSLKVTIIIALTLLGVLVVYWLLGLSHITPKRIATDARVGSILLPNEDTL